MEKLAYYAHTAVGGVLSIFGIRKLYEQVGGRVYVQRGGGAVPLRLGPCVAGGPDPSP
jgi:hypothetical protein